MPQPESFVKCACQHCGGRIEFPINGAGQKVCCPHCNKPTLLFLSPTGRVEVGGGRAARKRIYLMLATAVGLAAAGGSAFFYLSSKKSQPTPAATIPSVQISNVNPVVSAPVPPPKPQPPPDPWHGLKPGAVALEKTGDGRLVYAVGMLTNASTRQRFGVKVVIDVLDEQSNKVGSATDYAEVIEPGKAWKFRAMVTDKSASSAKLTNVKEQE